MPDALGNSFRRFGAAAAFGGLLFAGMACGSDTGDATRQSDSSATVDASSGLGNAAVAAAAALLPTPDPNQALPPSDVGSLRRLYDPALATMGLRLTRGTLIDTANGGYDKSDSGTHLALYVEPLDASYTKADYANGLWSVAALMTPDVFDRWSAVQSYDICQEPPPDVDDDDEPLPYTQINLTRTAGESIDWTSGDLPVLLAAARSSDEFDLVVARDIRETPEYKAANQAASDLAARATSTSTTSSGG